VLLGILLSQAHPVADWVCFAVFALSRIVPHLRAARNLAFSAADERCVRKKRGPSSPRRKLGLFHTMAPGPPSRSAFRLRSTRRKLGLFRTIAPAPVARW
jgi:hypothetical protein